MSGRLTRFFASRWGIVLAGAIIGILAPVLQKLGNPPNMGICVACFERDVAGADPHAHTEVLGIRDAQVAGTCYVLGKDGG